MGYDQDRYNSLISRASFDCSFYKGTIQDQSKSRLAMSFVGSPSWTMVNGLPALRQNAANDRASSAAVPCVVDVTIPYCAEWVLTPTKNVLGYGLYQVNGGGFVFYYDGAGATVALVSLTAASAVGRYCFTAAGTFPLFRTRHALFALDPVGLSGRAWVDGIPTAVTFVNVGAVQSCAAAALGVGGVGGPSVNSMLCRVWQGTPTNEDCVTLYQAAKTLVGGEI
jgi:hypothetical protein